MGGRVFIRNTVTTRENIGDFCDFIRNICRNKRNSIRNTLWGIFEFWILIAGQNFPPGPEN